MKRSFVESANSPYQFKKMIEESLKIKAAGILSNPDFQQAAALGLLEFQDNDDQLTPNLTPDELLKFFSQVVSYHDKEHPQGTLKRISSKTDTHSEEPNEDLEAAYKKLFGTSIDKDPAFKHFFESEQLDEFLQALIPAAGVAGRMALRALPTLARGAGSLIDGAGKLAGAAAGAIGRSVVRSAASSVADNADKKEKPPRLDTASVEETYKNFIAEYEAVLEENGIYEYDLDEATEFFLEQLKRQGGVPDGFKEERKLPTRTVDGAPVKAQQIKNPLAGNRLPPILRKIPVKSGAKP